ncbi:imm11 family protein [Paenibacillus campi]|uniref:imm11 family protein n=1 Tax=Paenibacillus campi TaxID=3106031 RepID=UPI002AFDDE34|nr:DUF1629 domain-containing protein [Paenibacillus sp. SGZ-1014]
MRIWELQNSVKNVGVALVDLVDLDVLDQLDGRRMGDDWKRIPVTIEGGKRKKRDFVNCLPIAPVVNHKTKSKLEPFLGNQVEFLPLEYHSLDTKDDTTFYVCNVIRIVDCVDEEKSIREYSKSGTFTRYKKIVFNEFILDMEKELKIFKIADISNLACFVTDQFKEFLESHRISGPDFELIWDSEVDYEHTEQKYDEAVRKINEDPQLVLSWAEAIELLKQGKCAVSDHWKIKYDANQNFLLGKLTPDLSYEFMQPLYIPPILLDLKWKESDV